MLIRLLPDDVSKMWDVIKDAIVPVLPPTGRPTEDVENEVLSACLKGILTVWVLGKHNGNSFNVYVVGTTMPILDTPTNTWSLLIYTLRALRPVPKELWIEGYDKLRRYAKSNNLSAICGYTDVPQVVELVKKLGGDTSVTYLTLEV